MSEILRQDAKTRFSQRVDNYVRCRPSYPDAVGDLLFAHCDLNEHSTVADIGSGTGLFSEILLKRGLKVIGVEPNPEMRRAGEDYLQDYPSFESIDGEAIKSGLNENSVDLVTVAQAFHWFDIDAFKQECRRILIPHGCVAIIYNERRTENIFQRAYEILLEQYAIDYADILKQHIDEPRFARFFSPFGYQTFRLDNFQDLDWSGIKGRLESSSYCPDPEHAHYRPLMEQLQELFTRCQRQGKVRLEYDTLFFIGKP